MKNLRRILVGLDFSTPSQNALCEAARIAQWDHAKLTAVHVLDHSVVEEIRDQMPQIELDFTVEAEGRLRAQLEGLLGPGHGVEALFVMGNPIRTLLQSAKETSADLVVMGTSGRSKEDDHVGPLASRCVRKAPANVLLVRRKQVGPFKKIVACIDFSENAGKAAAQAVHIAQQDQASLEFVHVHEPIGELMAGVGYFTAVLPQVAESNYQEETIARLERELSSFVDPIVAEAGSHPHQCRIVKHSNFRVGLMEYLSEVEADLVVLGTRGKTSLRNLLVGSTAEKIIAHAPCSVLAIKPDGFDYELE